MLKIPGWETSIIWYFFLGGIAGGAYFTAAIAENFGSVRDRAVARVGYLVALPLVAICGVLLIADLGVPTRFLNMVLRSFSASEATAALRRKVALVGMLFGFFLASYTGVLLSNSAMPFWADARIMGALFLASGGSTGMAAIALIMFFTGRTPGESWHKIEIADRYSLVIEILVLALFLALLGAAAQPITHGHYAALFWGGLVGAGLIVPLILNLIGGRVRAIGAVSAVLVLVGGFILRYVIVMSIQG